MKLEIERVRGGVVAFHRPTEEITTIARVMGQGCSQIVPQGDGLNGRHQDEEHRDEQGNAGIQRDSRGSGMANWSATHGELTRLVGGRGGSIMSAESGVDYEQLRVE
jgi:hypothetical protein